MALIKTQLNNRLNSRLKSLHQNEIETYEKNGFTKVGHKIFTDHDFQSLKTAVENVLAKNGNKTRSVAVGNMQFAHPEILYWLLSDNILDIAEDLLGPNIGLLNSTVFYKKPRSTDIASWHTDTGGFYKYNLFEDSSNLINLTFAITRTDKSNGCLKCLPGTQFTRYSHDQLAPTNDLISNPASIDEKNLDLKSSVHLELGENEASVHNINVVHGSDPNPSDDDRITLSVRFFSVSSRCNVEGFKKNSNFLRPFLVRGQDITNSGLQLFSIKK